MPLLNLVFASLSLSLTLMHGHDSFGDENELWDLSLEF